MSQFAVPHNVLREPFSQLYERPTSCFHLRRPACSSSRRSRQTQSLPCRWRQLLLYHCFLQSLPSCCSLPISSFLHHLQRQSRQHSHFLRSQKSSPSLKLLFSGLYFQSEISPRVTKKFAQRERWMRACTINKRAHTHNTECLRHGMVLVENLNLSAFFLFCFRPLYTFFFWYTRAKLPPYLRMRKTLIEWAEPRGEKLEKTRGASQSVQRGRTGVCLSLLPGIRMYRSIANKATSAILCNTRARANETCGQMCATYITGISRDSNSVRYKLGH